MRNEENVVSNKIKSKYKNFDIFTFVTEFWMNIRDVKNPTKEIQEAAFNARPWSLQFVDKLHPELQLKFIKTNPSGISLITNPIAEVKKIAIENDPTEIKWVKNPSAKLQKLAYAKMKQLDFITADDNSITGYIANPCYDIQLDLFYNYRNEFDNIEYPDQRLKILRLLDTSS